ncbi:MAG TPA: Gldg family protein [Isosphaeraceae bacterium]
MGKKSGNRKPGAVANANVADNPTSSTLTMEPPSRPAAGAAKGGPAFHPHAVWAVFARNYLAYFSNPAGYVFIVLFVVVSAIVTVWRPVFFANNLASLGTLNEWMPYILMIFIPAITMNAWAEERRLGTDELLLTLPARDAEVALGKFLAALGIYTTALLFSLALVAILYWLGSPDLGVIVTTYIGYWLMGMMLIAIGLVASVLSSNVTVAFILGVVFSAVPVFAGLFGLPFHQNEYRRAIEDLSVPSQFRDFGTGVVPLVGVVYFVGLAAAMLYLNMVLLGRRHWAGGDRSGGQWLHMMARVVSVVVALAAAEVLVNRYANARPDLSSEGLHRLSPESLKLIGDIPSDKPVYVEAYYSEDVPRELVQTKMDLLNKLREFAAASKGRILLNLVPTELYSEEARQAEKQYGITPKQVRNADEAKMSTSEVFLGVAFTSGPEEVVVPFFDPGLPVEYELARSIRVVARAQRKKVGVLQTDAKLLGGFDFRSMGQNQEWPIVSELKKQYEVSSVSADAPISGDLDVLLVAQPSSLTQRQIDNLTTHVKAGKATLLFVDPFPAVDPQLSPALPKPQPGGMFGGQPTEPKGSLDPLLDLLGVDWPQTEIVWNRYNPHPQFAEIAPEIVFIGKGGAGSRAFNPDQPETSGLQDLVMPYPGLIRSKSGGGDFTPLLQTGDDGGTLSWNDLVEQGPFGISNFNRRPRRRLSGVGYTLAAKIKGKPSASPKPADPAKKDEKPAEAAALNAIVVADLDLISDTFFRLRAEKVEGLDFDNVTFVLNCVDSLAGDLSYVDLRKRRIMHRTLTRLEERMKDYVAQAEKDTRDAEDEAAEKLKEAQKRLDESIDALRKRTDLDPQTKEIRLQTQQAKETLRLNVERSNIEDAKRRKIADSKAEKEIHDRRIQTGVRATAVLLPPLPVLILGAVVFFVRLGRENRGANPNRLA